MHGSIRNFHFVGNDPSTPKASPNMKDKYFLLNGRSYPTR